MLIFVQVIMSTVTETLVLRKIRLKFVEELSFSFIFRKPVWRYLYVGLKISTWKHVLSDPVSLRILTLPNKINMCKNEYFKNYK